jgi:hypothetical protein
VKGAGGGVVRNKVAVIKSYRGVKNILSGSHIETQRSFLYGGVHIEEWFLLGCGAV